MVDTFTAKVYESTFVCRLRGNRIYEGKKTQEFTSICAVCVLWRDGEKKAAQINLKLGVGVRVFSRKTDETVTQLQGE